MTHTLSDAYQFWDTLVRYSVAQILPPETDEGGGSAQARRTLLLVLGAADLALTDLEEGFQALQTLSQTEASSGAGRQTLIGVEAERGLGVLQAYRSHDSRFACGDALSLALQHWARLGGLVDATAAKTPDA